MSGVRYYKRFQAGSSSKKNSPAMKINYLLLVPAMASLCFACNSSSPDAAAGTAPEVVADTTAISPAPAAAMPASDTLTAAPVTATPVAATTSSPSGAGLNPPHGEPGHRCEIPVGAPLDSKPPAAGAAPAGGTPSSGSTTPPAGQPAATPAGMNPPHGQPGHDCNIPVGAPLKK